MLYAAPAQDVIKKINDYLEETLEETMSNYLSKETRHHSTEKLDVPEKVRSIWLEEYKDCFTFQDKPVTQIFLERLAKDFVTWARDNDNATRLEDFMIWKGIPVKTFYEWCNKYEIMKQALEIAKSIIASRRFHRADNRESSEKIFMFIQHQYDDLWAKAEKHQSDLRVEESHRDHTFILVDGKLPRPEETTAEQLKIEVDKTRE